MHDTEMGPEMIIRRLEKIKKEKTYVKDYN
jgi:hypothetical protein